jgi:hypothetical protein
MDNLGLGSDPIGSKLTGLRSVQIIREILSAHELELNHKLQEKR